MTSSKESRTLQTFHEEKSDDMMSVDDDEGYGVKSEKEQAPVLIAERENKAVNCTRWVFIIGLFLCGCILGGATYMVGRKSEEDAMQSQFDNEALELIEVSQEKVMRVFDVLGTLSNTITSFAHQNASRNEGQPPGFYTLPEVEHHLGTARSVSGAFMITYLPLIDDENREAWEDYSRDNQDWILEANGLGPDAELEPIPSVIWAYYDPEEEAEEADNSTMQHRSLQRTADCSSEGRRRLSDIPKVEPKGSGPYSPVWQRSPPPEATDTFILNYNMFDRPVFEKAVNFIKFTRKPAFLDVCTQTAWFGAETPDDGANPQTVVVQPVFEDFDTSSPIVGVVAAVIPWNVFFDDILNHGSEPVQLVMSNTCDEEFTYEVHAREALFQGEVDVHDEQFDEYMHSSIFADFANPENLPEEAGEYCIYTIKVYPTEETQDAFRGPAPIIYVTVVVSIFAFTSLIFLMYDFFVSQRQEKVLSTANKTQVLVSSLFPKDVQDQVLDAANDTRNSNNAPKSMGLSGAAADYTSGESNETSAYTLKHTPPIANLYPETTIMFADIAGFTKWSSSKEPTEVFTLLETLYHGFDTIAKKRGVFKVETIGDCYVAVCGLPDARSDHYAVMARFAHVCMQKAKEVMRELEPTLGPETLDLEMRAGLHAGSVTAGVLRGEKARFQLFGDTMNTASRMESNGVKGRIQCSEELADLLIAHGKGKWLTQREDKIVAKGKGELTTYWLEIHSGSKASGSVKSGFSGLTGSSD